MAWLRKDWLILLALTALAALLRFYRLGLLPPGFQFDEAFNAIDAQGVMAGSRPLFLPANAGREVVYTYFQAGLATLFGLNVYTLRLASALLGTLAVPVTYLLYRGLLREHSRTIAAGVALVLALSLWHLHFSRYAIRVISMPVIFSGAFGLAWLGAHGTRPRTRLLAYLGSGLLTGLSVWTHPTGRFAPFVLILFSLWLLWQHPARRRLTWDAPLGGLLITGLVALTVFLPLGLEFYRYPEFFLGHASEVSVFAARVSGDAPGRVLAENVLHILGMFTVAGDREWTHNLAGRPVFDLALGAVYYLGLALWVLRLGRGPASGDRDALALFAFWALVMVLPSLLSEAAPNYSRMLPALPALFTAAGLGLDWLYHLRRPARWVGPALAAAVVAYGGSQTVYDYFVRFAARPEVYYLYDADKLDALTYLRRFTGEYQVYLSQLWGDKHSTVYFLRGPLGIKSVDTGDTLVLPPPGQGAVYAFPAEQEERARQLAQLWPGVTPETVPDPFGQTLLYVVRLDPATAAGWPPGYTPTITAQAAFVDAPTLLGMQAAVPDKQVSLFWRAETPLARSLTSFIHLIDRDGHRVGQIDKLPGNGSYPTTVWTPGERVVDRAYPTLLDLCAGGETVRVQVGWYDLADPDAPRPRADAAGHTALAGALTLPRLSHPRPYLEPRVRTDTVLSPTLTLLGYSLHDEELQPGSPLTVDLFWHSTHTPESPSPAELPVALVLGNAPAETVLWEGPIAPAARWRSGEAICARIRTALPPELAPGGYPLALHWDPAQSAPLAELTVGPSTRRFTPPPLIRSLEADWADEQGGQIRLLGLAGLTTTAGAQGPVLVVDLVWQGQARVAVSYKVFVHLLDGAGNIVAQSDGVPAQDYATHRWAPGEIVVDSRRLELPGDLPAGEYRLVAGLYEPISGQRLAGRDAQGQPLPDSRAPLGPITLP